jgi:tripartite-type tricarboxylate transporter receptor subunit TctC
MDLLRFAFLAVTLLSIPALPANAAEDYPSGPITFIIPSSIGGGTDLSLRVLAEGLEGILGQKIEVLNKPADSGAEGLAYLAKAQPDGYTLGAVFNGQLAAAPQIRDLPYTLESFTPVASTFESDYVVCAHQDFPASDGAALVANLREKPLRYIYGNEGKGSGGYFAAERFFDTVGAVLRSQSFNGTSDAAKNFAARRVDFYVGTIPPILKDIKSGEAKCLIVLSSRRPDSLPGISTLQDLGAPGAEAKLWRMILAPKGLPEDKLSTLEAAIRKAMAAPAMQAFLEANGERAFVQDGAGVMARLRKESIAFSEAADQLVLNRE